MSCNNHRTGLNEILDLNVTYTGCDFEIGNRSIKSGDNIRKVLDVILQNLGLSTSGTNLWFGIGAPTEIVNDEDYYLQSTGEVWQYLNSVWADTGITLGGGGGPVGPTEWGTIVGDINLQSDLISLVNSAIFDSDKTGKNLHFDDEGKLNSGVDISEVAPGLEALVLSYNGNYPSDGSAFLILKEQLSISSDRFEVSKKDATSLFYLDSDNASIKSVDINVKNLKADSLAVIGSDTESGENTISGKTFITNLRTSTMGKPAASNSPGEAGMIKWDDGFIYICVAFNTWKRAPLTTW